MANKKSLARTDRRNRSIAKPIYGITRYKFINESDGCIGLVYVVSKDLKELKLQKKLDEKYKHIKTEGFREGKIKDDETRWQLFMLKYGAREIDFVIDEFMHSFLTDLKSEFVINTAESNEGEIIDENTNKEMPLNIEVLSKADKYNLIFHYGIYRSKEEKIKILEVSKIFSEKPTAYNYGNDFPGEIVSHDKFLEN